jgi:lysophospholipase L1-like esterase
MQPIAHAVRLATISAVGMLACSAALAAESGTPDVACSTKSEFAPRYGSRILFLGDSNTYAAGYVNYLDAFLFTRFPGTHFELINLGLPSETVSGLSEPDHPYPRPDVHERLERALAKTHPDYVLACYGMNDGIYYPFDEGRFKKYQEGIRRLIERVRVSGAGLTLLTPPPFDVEPVRRVALPEGAKKYSWMAPYTGYDSVLERYSQWLVSLRSPELPVLDVHMAMKSYLATVRRDDPKYQLSGDGVHFGPSGHWLLAELILEAWHAQECSPLEVHVYGDQARTTSDAVTHVKEDHGTILVNWNSHIPMPLDPRWDLHVAKTDRIARRWIQYRLTITGLTAPRYELLESGRTFANASREDLAAGVDLRRFPKLSTVARSQQLLDLVVKRQEILSHAWLSDVGFKRPDTPAGLPLEEAKKKAAELEAKIRKLAQPAEIVLTIRPAR